MNVRIRPREQERLEALSENRDCTAVSLCQVPAITVRPLRLAYGGTLVLTPDLVTVSDVDTELDDIIFTLEQKPRHGDVTKDARMMREGEQFSFEHLVNSTIR